MNKSAFSLDTQCDWMSEMEMLSFYESLNLYIAYADILYFELNNDKSITMWNLE